MYVFNCIMLKFVLFCLVCFHLERVLERGVSPFANFLRLNSNDTDAFLRLKADDTDALLHLLTQNLGF